ncbi:heavy metal translocating P-type ATPase [Paenibacillus sp. GSMTC-2017]|uniref:heavy metal translocating P-type ATPase n=1 Tax=Paenibacillus sp. GSMTC-2017 TaxID=2794350 RepID=UPI0018D63E49|nr:heavy metal translocating P-type ATPase [Paenibacillus sp. GSMTC-2017]MBH5316509.1 heavy metal translocating P-type ATPase [Paenibacillus sp. GSMTC-2017]
MSNALEDNKAVKSSEMDLTIQGMSCAACATRIERVLTRLEGVREAAVSFPLRTAWLQIEPGTVTKEQVTDKVKGLGFTAMTNESASEGLQRERKGIRLRLMVSIILTLPLLLGMVHHLPLLEPFVKFLPTWLLAPWLHLALATIIQFVIGMPFYFGAYYAVRQRSANMDVLVVLGTTAAYLYSHYIVFAQGLTLSHEDTLQSSPLYFETSAVVITAVLLGKFIETSASLRTQNESLGFTQLHVQTAMVERAGTVTPLRTEFIRSGDVVYVDEMEIIPVDGTVQQGDSTVDEALLTGESISVQKKAGDSVWAGTRNMSDKLKLVTTAAGHDTMLNRIQELVHQGQRSKSSIQSQVDVVASWFVPTMLVIALSTFFIWGFIADPGNWSKAAICAIAVLLAACPCALGLAAPISLVIASGRLAKQGIITKEAGAVERLAFIETILLDKTGTLTEGKLRISSMESFGIGRTVLLRLAVALEAESTHPLAVAVRNESLRLGLVIPDAEKIQYTVGAGTSGWIKGEYATFGNARYMAMQSIVIESNMKKVALLREGLGETVLYATLQGKCVGFIGFTDSIKRSASEMVTALKKLGVEPIMATGDHPAPAKAVAHVIGIKSVHSSMLPEGKLALVNELKNSGKKVAMAGDGWNDAPALAASDVGIAMGNGTYGALHAGHVTLLFSRLMAIPEAIRVSRLTIRNIRQNLAFAFLYNAIIIPFAAIGYLKPWMAGTAMALSSVSVVANALLLKSRLIRASESGH